MSAWMGGFLLALLPLLILVGFLACGRYPGEPAIDRCRRSIVTPLRPRPRMMLTLGRYPPSRLVARGGNLIATSLAGRAPPSPGGFTNYHCDVGGIGPPERKHMNIMKKVLLAFTAFALFALPEAAFGHVTVSPEEAPATGYAMLNFTVPHGCDASPTNRIRVQMPDQVISATPGVVPGWDISTKEGKLPEPAEQHGEMVTQGIREITWTGGPLPADQLQQFPVSVAFSGDPGETVEFKVLQGCTGGAETAWIQSSAGGEEPESPAPAVVLEAADEGHGQDVEATDSDSDSADNGLAIVALIVGALGLLTGIGALIGIRRK